jgi:hypothetical protein
MKMLLALLLAVLITPVARGDAQPFSVDAGAAVGDNAENQSNTVANMKYRAVVEWLQRYLGNRYAQVEKQVTPEFAERYILDYKVGRVPTNRSLLQVTGHLDADSLRRWARVVETKHDGGSSLKPLFLLSSTIPGLTIQPGDTAGRLPSSTLAQSLLVMANTAFSKFNAKAVPFDGNGVVPGQPPVSPNDIARLRETASSKGFNSAVWMHLTPCKGCNGLRLTTHLYNLTQGRLALLHSDDLNLSTGDLASPEQVHAALKGPGKQFQQEVDSAVSEGTLFSASRRLLVEGIDSYRVYQDLETNIPKLEYVTQCILKRSEPHLAEFEVLTNLTPDELSQRLQAEDLGGFRLRLVRSDAQSLVMRYGK